MKRSYIGRIGVISSKQIIEKFQRREDIPISILQTETKNQKREREEGERSKRERERGYNLNSQ